MSESAAASAAVESAPVDTASSAASETGGMQQPPPAPRLAEPSWKDFFLGPMGLILIAVWLMVLWSIRKQKRGDEERKKELASLRKGDQVITIGRMHGTVVALTEDSMTLKPDPKSGVTLKFDRAALWKILSRGAEKPEGDDSKGGERKS